MYHKFTDDNTDIAIASDVIFNISSEDEFQQWFNADYGYDYATNELIKRKVASQIFNDCIENERYEFIKYLKNYI